MFSLLLKELIFYFYSLCALWIAKEPKLSSGWQRRLIRQGGSESSLGAQVILLVLSSFGSNNSYSNPQDSSLKMSRLMTKPTKWLYVQQRLNSVWASPPVWSESSLCTQWVAKDPSFLHVDSKDCSEWADAQAAESSLGAHATLLGLSWGSSNVSTFHTHQFLLNKNGNFMAV